MPLSSFRRHGPRDDRRRRLLTEELAVSGEQSDADVEPEETPALPTSAHYGNAAFLRNQSRLIDLVPRGLVALSMLTILAAAIPVGLEAAYAWMLDRVAKGGSPVMALDLAAKGSLGCWFSSLMLLAASMAALVYSVRRHRIDDYQGRYRIWLGAALCWFLMATDQAASLREGFRDLMTGLTGTPLVGDGTLWWIILYGLALGAVGSRLLLDMRPNRLAMAALLVAVIAYAIVLTDAMGGIALPEGISEVMFRTGAEMAGNLLLLAAMGLHARYVILDAEGCLPLRRSKDDAAEEDEEVCSSTGERWTKVDPPHSNPQPLVKRAGTPRVASAASSVSPANAPLLSPVNRKLTKGERKALKERLLRERLERQRQRG